MGNDRKTCAIRTIFNSIRIWLNHAVRTHVVIKISHESQTLC